MASEPPGRDARRAAARILRIAGIGAAVVLALALAGAAFVSSRYFAAAVEAQLAKAMLETKHRTLTFGSPLEFSFWPNAGFAAGRVALSEPNSAEEFASVAAARLSVAVMPLLRGRIVVDRCEAEGLRAVLVKRRDGTLNIDDFLVSRESSGTDWAIDATGIALRDATLIWRDEAGATEVAANDIALDGSGLQAETAAKTMKADRLSLSGRIDGTRVTLGFAGMAASPAALVVERASADVRHAGNGIAVGVSLDSRLVLDLERGSLAAENLAGVIDAAHPRLAGPVRLSLRGALHADRKSSDARLSAKLDESTAAVNLKMSRYSPPTLGFNVEVDRLDVDRYLSPDDPASPPEKAATKPLALEGMALDGTATIGSLKVAGLTTSNIRLEVRGANGRLGVRDAGRAPGR